MNISLIKQYIDDQPVKVVTKLDLPVQNKI